MEKVFLGGTCNNSTWRDEIIPILKIPYFNPVVEDWTPEYQEIEENEKEFECDIHLYVITKEMTGVYSIAEIIDSAYNWNKYTLVQVVPDGFDKTQLKSLAAVLKLAEKIGAMTFISSDFDDLVAELNNFSC